MDAILLARVQFGLTAGFHFIFPPLTIGLGWLNLWMMTKYLKHGDGFYRGMARFWTKVFALSFAVGVATGIVMEFQFGTNWAGYSRFVGDIFGAPLAAEGIFAFFLESTFLGVLLFGWDRVSRKVHWFSALMVAVGATLSAFWIIVANSWQQTPAGYHIVNNRAELTDFWAAVFNPSTLPRYFHTVDAAVMTGAIFMVGISAWFILKGRHLDFARQSLHVSLVVGLIASLAQMGLGHGHAVQVAHTQPAKLAAMEGLMETQSAAPSIIVGLPDADNECIRGEVCVPVKGMLSIMAYGNRNAVVRGLKDFPKDEWPPVLSTFISFRLMVSLGVYMVALTGIGVLLMLGKSLDRSRIFMRIALWSIPVPFIANELGWITAEMGRQPWIVYGLLKTQDAASVTVPAAQILASIIMFTLVYMLLFGLWFFLLKRTMNDGPQGAPAAPAEVEAAV